MRDRRVNKRWVLATVIWAASAGEICHTWAKVARVWGSRAGELVWLRWGSGAR